MQVIKPEDCRYTASHEWVSLPEDGVVTVGITQHAQQLLGDVVYVELPACGDAVVVGKEVMVVESVKAAADVYGPIAGEVVAVNEALQEQPELVNQSPQGEGWLFKLKLADEQALAALMTLADYEKTH